MKNWAINFIRNNEAAQIFLTFVVLVILACLIGKFFPTFGGTILCLLLIGGYYGVLFRCLKFCDINFLEELIKDFPRILLAGVIGTGLVILVINSYNTIFMSDSLETWEPTIYCEEITFSDPHLALKNLRGSINHSDYNNFLPMLMALPMHIFGKSFLCYVLYVWLMFGLPAIFFASAVIKEILDKAGFKNLPCSAVSAIFMLLPMTSIGILGGYANISILLPGSILLAMLLSLNKSEIQHERLLFISLLCVFAVFQARTAAYMIVGMFLGYTFYIIILGVRERMLLHDLILLCKKFFYIGAFGLLITLPLFFTFIKHALTYDIITAYSGYTMGMDFSARVITHIEYFGLVTYGIFIIGVFASLFNKKLMTYAIFFATWFFSAEFLICRVQLIGGQHNYTMILPFAFIITTLILIAFEKKKKFCAALLLLLCFNFFHAYSVAPDVSPYFNARHSIPVRNDIEDLKKFVEDMNELTANNNKKIYSLLNGFFYNEHTLTKIFIPESHNALPKLFGSSNVDLRDGFSMNFFNADYVIVSDPIQIHLLPESQAVIVKPYELMTTPSPISRHFKQIKDYNFSLDGTSTVKFKVYEKISPYEKSDIDFVEKIFVELYPNQPELFKNRFEKYKQEHFKE